MHYMKFNGLPVFGLFVLFNGFYCTIVESAANKSDLPGGIVFTTGLRQQLKQVVQQKGADYRPRTNNLNNDEGAIYNNRLLLEASPYLQQHAHNPVNWYPWGDEAFAQAAKLNRPVLLSIGYSTCHWCHVMEEESYDNPEIAAYLNQHFIAIKVDREARPDIDAIYMRAVQTITGQGGWPLNVWLLPNKQAFFGGTYFPPHDQHGRKGLMTVLRMVHEAYHQDGDKINRFAEQLTAAIQDDITTVSDNSAVVLNQRSMLQVTDFFKNSIDPDYGGIGEGMKFPSSTPIRLLLRQNQHEADEKLLKKVYLTLNKMAEGGIYDQIGGGFHRYATDPQWRVPHFEKMLYDNARLAVDYVEAYQQSKNKQYKQIVMATLDYIQREMTSAQGGFYSATDADSLNDRHELEEGWYFTWSNNEIQTVVNMAHLPVIKDWFGISNTGELDGRNVLYRPLLMQEVSRRHGLTETRLMQIINSASNEMLKARTKRQPPLRDDKIITAWNGLMITAFANAGFVFNRPDYISIAQKAADYIINNMLINHRLQRLSLNKQIQGPAFVSDYAFFIDALLQLYQVDSQARWLQTAIELQTIQDQWYLDTRDGIYFNTAKDAEKLLYREKPVQDGVLPSGNSISAYNLLTLYKITTQEYYFEQASRLIKALQPQIEQQPLAMTDLLIANDFALSEGKEIVLLLADDAVNTKAMLKVLRDSYRPEQVRIIAEEEQSKANNNLSPLLTAKRCINGKTTAYVCRNRVCKQPTTDPEVFAELL